MKPTLLLSSLLLLTGTAHAQLGLRAGANATTITTEPAQYQQASADAKTGYQVGVFYEQKLGTRFSVVPELQFSRQHTQLQSVRSWSGTVGVSTYTSDYRLRQSYLHLPVLLRARFGSFYVEGGPQASLQLASREVGTVVITSSYDSGSRRQEFNRAAADSYRRLNVGACVGLGVQLPAGFGLGLRGTVGLLSLDSKEAALPGYTSELHNQSVQASISYQLRPRS